jgi:hypothetical protein
MTSTGSDYAINVSLYGNDQDVSYADLYLDFYLDGVYTSGGGTGNDFGRLDQNGVWEAEAGSYNFPGTGSNQACIVVRVVGGTARNVYIDDIYIQDPNTPVLDWEMF